MQQRMRVLLDASCLSDGRAAAGIGRYAREITAALQQRDALDVHVATPSHPPRSESRPGRFMHAQTELLRTAHGVRPHILHGLGGEPALGVPLHRQVVTVHDVEMWRELRTSRARGLALRAYGGALIALYRRCAAIIAVSRTTAEEAIAALGLDPTRVHVVPHGVSRAFAPGATPGDEPTRTALGLRGRYLLWSGSLRHHDPRKGIDTMLAALASLNGAPTLVLAGSLGDEATRVDREARGLGVRVTLCGRLTDDSLAAVYRGAAALVMPSLHEGFGLPVLEAMASGTPVLTTSAGNLPELVGEAGQPVPPADVRSLAAALRRLLADADYAARMRHEGLRRAAGFSWARSADLTEAVYREITRAG